MARGEREDPLVPAGDEMEALGLPLVFPTEIRPMIQRVFMIGWDGATFDLIRPWVKEGKLPNIARLMQNGVHGPLRSTVPPWTFPAWTSFMTGKNPGKHGIFDFFRPRTGSYSLEYVNGGHRRGETFWQILSRAGRRVISISLPCTFPPDPVNGIMISGFDFPGEGPGSDVDARGMHPPQLYDELLQTVGRHPIDASIIKEVNQGRFDLVLERMLETLRKKAVTAKYLLRNKPWECFMILFGESDGVGHQFWKYCDPQSPLFTEQPTGLRDAILRVYQELDRQAGELLEMVPPDTAVLMMSDHGFGGVGDWTIYPNAWLQQKGFLSMRRQGKQLLGRAINALKLWAVAHFPARLQRLLYRCGGRLLGLLESRVRYGQIEWTGTKAYFDENPYFPVLRVNLRGRQPGGIVEPGEEYDEVRDRLIQELESWRHPVTGAAIVEKAYRREEVYDGPCVEQAADIIPKWASHQGYSYAFKMSSKAPAGVCIEQIDPRKPENMQFFTSKSGTHRDHGIFLAHAPGVIREGDSVEGANIIDLAPTILHLLGVPVPEDMDGRVLERLFANAQHVDYSQSAMPGQLVASGASGEVYSSEDEQVIAERLTSLGYME
jgi:predicted AlkP superfamily phosphohydrolase/phosphomutase